MNIRERVFLQMAQFLESAGDGYDMNIAQIDIGADQVRVITVDHVQFIERIEPGEKVLEAFGIKVH